jgi:hypothetical protein
MGGTCSKDDMRKTKMFVAKPEAKRPLEKPRYRWRIILKFILVEDNVMSSSSSSSSRFRWFSGWLL